MAPDRGQLGIYTVLIVGAVSLVVLSIVLLLGTALVGGMAGAMGVNEDPVNRTASPDPITGTAVGFENTNDGREITRVYRVEDSTGTGVKLTGAEDSFMQAEADVELATDGNWSVSTWAAVDAGAAGKTMATVSADGRVVIQYNGTDSEWRAWYYEEGGRDSYLANVSAPNQPGDLSLVTATANETHFWIYRNGTRGETKSITTDSIASLNLSATNWDGRLDETRTFDDYTNDTEQSDLTTNPVAPRPDRNRTARLTYDEGEGDTTAMYFTGERATLSNFTWVDGLAGNLLTEGADYTLNQNRGEITALDGGAIDGAPVVWIDYEYRGLNVLGQISETAQIGFQLMNTGIIVVPVVSVLAVLIGGMVLAIRRVSDFDGAGSDLFGRDRGDGR